MHIPVPSKHIKCNQFKTHEKPMKEDVSTRTKCKNKKKINKETSPKTGDQLICALSLCVCKIGDFLVESSFVCYRFLVFEELENYINMLTAYSHQYKGSFKRARTVALENRICVLSFGVCCASCTPEAVCGVCSL